MTTSFTSAPIAASGASAAVAITDPAVIAGQQAGLFNGTIPVFGGPPNPAVPSIYVTLGLGPVYDSNGGPKLRFTLSKSLSAAPRHSRVTVLGTFDVSTVTGGARPIAQVTCADEVRATITDYSSGSLTLTVIQ